MLNFIHSLIITVRHKTTCKIYIIWLHVLTNSFCLLVQMKVYMSHTQDGYRLDFERVLSYLYPSRT